VSLEALGDAAIVVSVIFTTLFILGYATLAPWWKTAIGRSLFLSKSWMAALSWMAFLRTTMDVDSENGVLVVLRFGVWVLLPVITVYTFWALLVKEQILKGKELAWKNSK
jgi:hypothetical protein